MLKWFVGLINLEHDTARDRKVIWAFKRLLSAHVFDYIVLRVNPGPTSCEDLAMALIVAGYSLGLWTGGH